MKDMALQLQTLGLKIAVKEDCEVYENRPDHNFNGTELAVGSSLYSPFAYFRSFLKFDIPDVEILSGTLWMFGGRIHTDDTAQCYVRFTDQPWSEGVITWNTQPPPMLLGTEEIFGYTGDVPYSRDYLHNPQWFGVEVSPELLNAYRGRTLTLILSRLEQEPPRPRSMFYAFEKEFVAGYGAYLAINAYEAPPMCAVTFNVMDEAGIPLDLAFVKLGDLEAWTDVNGQAFFSSVALGTYNWSVHKDGYNSQQGVSTFTEEITYTLTVTLTVAEVTPCLVRFSVQDAATVLPLEGAECRLGANSLLTDEGGLATFTGVEPAVYDWAITLAGYYSKSGSIECVVGGQHGIDEALVKYGVDGARVWWLIAAGAAAVGLIYLSRKNEAPI